MSVEKPILLIISAASGTGKSSLSRALVNSEPHTEISISHTTREIRGAERNGVDYFFVSEEEFINMKGENQFAESALVYGCYYGTTREMIDKKMDSGKNVVLDIDWEGAEQVARQYPSALKVFLLPPSLEELAKRLRKRGRDSKESMSQRLDSAVEDMKNFSSYDVLILNDDFDAALADLRTLLPTNPGKPRPVPDSLLRNLGIVSN